MTTTAHSSNNTPTLAEIAAAQATNNIFAFDRGHAERELASLQALYSRRKAQLVLLCSLFDEGSPEVTLRGEIQQLTLRGELLGDTYTALSESLSNVLAKLEKDIVQAHLNVEQWAADIAGDYAGRTDYAPLVLALCAPAAPLVVRLTPEQSTTHAQVA